MDSIQTSEVEIATMHDIHSTCFGSELIDEIDIVNTSVSNDNHGGNSAQGNRERHRSIVVESRAQTVLSSSMPKFSLEYIFWPLR